ncbi:hypothetical protein A2U01_0066978, partial [Trifolium medium]|nr:hypothetical protein [Trifolium medium]
LAGRDREEAIKSGCSLEQRDM